ncbi:hypothetical protein TARUN_2509 [Trichoderma arundinaceum]|uniref:Zn(2)-C6 fungal-type domain-containing protein n=1 Tax=Trichoderma arundinaceum TaxID=490622 RepID=A0A395NUP3_TRIAR|nr:hypothetical protein TARUN_2509 [Trichoderma arundinaceum]
MDRGTLGRSRSSKRTSTACEQCRAAKAKCQPSEEPGVCTKCLALRRECISRTTPRPRRSRRTLCTEEIEPSSQMVGQPHTFSIDYFLPARLHAEDGFEILRELHNSTLDSVLNVEDSIEEVQATSQSASPSSSSTQSRSIYDMWRKPQFNVASAESLLVAFRSMLESLPFMILPEDSAISHVASTKPFVLLAILTVASGSRTAQKHSLYDDEFLKILGLKYVAGGERSIQLLQGLIIYCAWYPFHLKPKNTQLPRCMRMAEDLVQELCLDKDFLQSHPWERVVTEGELDKIRTYLAYVYLVSTYIVVWKGSEYLCTRIPPWAGTAIDILEQNAQADSDHALAALVRLSTLFSDASNAINEREKQTLRNSELILLGLEQSYQQVRSSILATCSSVFEKRSVRLQDMFFDIYLDVGSLLAFPVAVTSLSARIIRFPPPTSKMYSATKKIRRFLDYICEVDDTRLLSFTVNDWTRLIVVLTLSFRLSFPLELCPDFEWAWANSEIQLDLFLSEMLRDRDIAAASNSILSANRTVFNVLKSKYKSRLDSLGQSRAGQRHRTFGCPVMGGGLNLSVPLWTPELTEASEPSTRSHASEIIPLYHDVWTAVAAEWQDINQEPLDSLNDLLNDAVTGHNWPV